MLIAVAFAGVIASSARADTGGPAAGQALAEARCTTCHVVTPGGTRETASDAAPSFAAVARMSSTTNLSLRVFLQTSHGRMPDLVLSREQIDDIAAYILSLQPARS
jgi:mono/diheme cytochrome c family protein